MGNFDEVISVANDFCNIVKRVETTLAESETSVPPEEYPKAVAEAFWRIWEHAGRFVDQNPLADYSAYKNKLMSVLGPQVWRCELYSRSYFKPHGLSGDYGIVEMMYDLEGKAGKDPYKSAVINCLEYCFSTIHSVVGIWDRRRWLCEQLLLAQSHRKKLSVLDVACGGARYIADFMHASPRSADVEVVLIDGDPAALAYATRRSLAPWATGVKAIRGNIGKLDTLVGHSHFDVVISAGMFDYLERPLAKRVLRSLCAKTSPTGRVLLTNYHKSDASALCKDWGADWPLVFRDEEDMVGLSPCGWGCEVHYSNNRSLMMCRYRRQ